MKTKLRIILTLFLAFTVQLSFAQQRTVTGNVSDDSGMPLIGATIAIAGTSTGTSSDFDGNYSISVNQGDVLSFSYVGYSTQDVTVGESSTVNVTLLTDNTLEEIVVTAYGIQRQKKTLTYQAEAVGSKELMKVAPTRAASALAGKVAGVQINVQSNGVNPSTQILLRGLRSISQNNSALIVIDGSVASQGAFDALNPNDIESLNVLKGATAAALYGSAASNGAILV